MKKIILFLLAAPLLFACDNTNKDKASVSGNISNLKENTVLFLDFMSATTIAPFDSTIVDDKGYFSFGKEINKSGYYRLRINKQNFVNLILNKGEKPIINGNGDNLMATYTIEGSNESTKLQEFNKIYKQNITTQDSLGKIYQANQNDTILLVELQKKRTKAMKDMNDSFVKLINKNPASLVSLAATDLLNPDENLATLEKVDAALAKKMPNTDYYQKFHQKMERLKQLAIGSVAPELTLAGRDGNMISLSSLKGNTVLIDFWASWCSPCRRENPNVKVAYTKYHDKGFEVFSVSLDGLPQQDNPKQDWINAINKDGLIWKNHVSDLKGWSSLAVSTYGFQSIPFTVLLDKEGKIIAKNIRGEELQQQLKKIFK